MAAHLSALAWGAPCTEKPGSYGPWGHEELDTTERLTLMSFRQDNNKKWLK